MTNSCNQKETFNSFEKEIERLYDVKLVFPGEEAKREAENAEKSQNAESFSNCITESDLKEIKTKEAEGENQDDGENQKKGKCTSIGVLGKMLLEMMKEAPEKELNLTLAAKSLKVSKRRIYDVVNIMECILDEFYKSSNIYFKVDRRRIHQEDIEEPNRVDFVC